MKSNKFKLDHASNNIESMRLAMDLMDDDEEDGNISDICAAIHGFQDTAKSGIAMDSRTPDQIEAGYKVAMIDLDDACKPLHNAHWHSDPNIKIINPVQWIASDREMIVDYDSTIAVIGSLIKVISDRIISGEKVASFVLDGLDKLLTAAELQMRAYLDLEIDEGVSFVYWRRRNKAFLDILYAAKALSCAKYFITHDKKKDIRKGDNVIGEIVTPDWYKSVPGMMHQIIHCERSSGIDGTVTYTATVEKYKGRPEILMKKAQVLSVEKGIVTWNGIPPLRSDVV